VRGFDYGTDFGAFVRDMIALRDALCGAQPTYPQPTKPGAIMGDWIRWNV
jgi:hypothetical protein